MAGPNLSLPGWAATAIALAPIAVLAGACAWDAWRGEPRAAWHPVVWMGRYLDAAGRRVRPWAPAGAFIAGALAWCLGALAFGGLAWAAQSLCRHALAGLAQDADVRAAGAEGVSALVVDSGRLLAALGWLLVFSIVLKTTLSLRMLCTEVAAVEAALARSLDAGRARLARLVSRDGGTLDAVAVREAAIESLAENLNDSFVAPVAWFALAGLPGAAVYRFANTADAMWGYRGDWEWAGKWAARADDVLSWAPARITAALLWALAVPACGRRARWRTLRAEARRTPSPNGGWPMAAMALALGVRLAKPGVYLLNEAGRSPEPRDTMQAIVLARKVALAHVLLAQLAMLLIVIAHGI